MRAEPRTGTATRSACLYMVTILSYLSVQNDVTIDLVYSSFAIKGLEKSAQSTLAMNRGNTTSQLGITRSGDNLPNTFASSIRSFLAHDRLPRCYCAVTGVESVSPP